MTALGSMPTGAGVPTGGQSEDGGGGGTTYTAGPGISIAGSVISNSAPFIGSAGKITSLDKCLVSGDSIFAGWQDFFTTHNDPNFGALVPMIRYITETYTHFGLSPPTFQNTAVSGQTSAALLAAVNAQVLTPITNGVKHVFLCIGANDVAGSVAPATTAANVVSIINQAHAINPAVFFHVVLNPFVFSEDPSNTNNVNMGNTNAALAAAVLALPNVIVHDWQSVAYEWENRNNPEKQLGLLVQGGTHPSKVGQVVCSDCVFADLAFSDIPAFYRFQALGAQVPYKGSRWFESAANECSYFFQHTSRMEHFPLRYLDAATGAFSANDPGIVLGGGIFGNGGQRMLVAGSQFPNPTTKAWGAKFRAQYGLQQAASFSEVGLITAAGDRIAVRNDVALGANLRLVRSNGGPTNIDLGAQLTAGYHDIGLYFTGDTPATPYTANSLIVLIDIGQGWSVFNTTVLTNMPTNPVAMYVAEGGTMHCDVAQAASFWVHP